MLSLNNSNRVLANNTLRNNVPNVFHDPLLAPPVRSLKYTHKTNQRLLINFTKRSPLTSFTGTIEFSRQSPTEPPAQ